MSNHRPAHKAKMAQLTARIVQELRCSDATAHELAAACGDDPRMSTKTIAGLLRAMRDRQEVYIVGAKNHKLIWSLRPPALFPPVDRYPGSPSPELLEQVRERLAHRGLVRTVSRRGALG